jgi:hypothetical protein
VFGLLMSFNSLKSYARAGMKYFKPKAYGRRIASRVLSVLDSKGNAGKILSRTAGGWSWRSTGSRNAPSGTGKNGPELRVDRVLLRRDLRFLQVS